MGLHSPHTSFIIHHHPSSCISDHIIRNEKGARAVRTINAVVTSATKPTRTW